MSNFLRTILPVVGLFSLFGGAVALAVVPPKVQAEAIESVRALWPADSSAYSVRMAALIKELAQGVKDGSIDIHVFRGTVTEHLNRDVADPGIDAARVLWSQAEALNLTLRILANVEIDDKERIAASIDCGAFLGRVQRAIIPGFKPKRAFMNVSPPAGVKNAFAGMSPSAISDPDLRAKYEAAIKENSLNMRENVLQREFRKIMEIQGQKFSAFLTEQDTKHPGLRDAVVRGLREKQFSDTVIDAVTKATP